MLKWYGLALLLLGLGGCGSFGFLGLMWFEPPIEAPWVLQAGARPGQYLAGPLTETEYWFSVEGLGPGASCSLTGTDSGGRVIFAEKQAATSGSGCRSNGKPVPGEIWTLEMTAGAGAYLKAQASHGDGFPHIGAILWACLFATVTGFCLLIAGLFRKNEESPTIYPS